MKAIILIGGTGTRLYPTTFFVNKHFLSIYNKPMVYYPVSIAMLSGIKEYIFIINKEDEPIFLKLKDHLEKLGLSVNYVVQHSPKGLAHGLILIKRFIKDNEIFLYLLGDNILYGHDVPKILSDALYRADKYNCAVVFGYPVKDPERFGVVEFDDNGKVVKIEEKPRKPKSNYAVIGIYVLDSRAIAFAEKIKPSLRGELEITSVLEEYLRLDKLHVQLLGRGFAWFDAGTHDSFIEAGNFVATIERKTGLMIGCLEEIAFRNGWISREDLLMFAKIYSKTDYGNYLIRLAEEEK